MKKLSIAAVIIMFAAATTVFLTNGPTAIADDTFNIQVEHRINGRALGLSKDLPVVATVYLDGDELTQIPLSFKDVVRAELPAGEYLITVSSVEIGPIPSMTVGPVVIPPGAEVRLLARLGAGKTPVIDVK